jgi:hypothetical protein
VVVTDKTDKPKSRISDLRLPTAFSTGEAPEQTISRAGFGLAVGGFIGFLLAGGTGLGLGAATGLALAAMSAPDSPKGQLTPERKALYERAMASVESSERLEQIAAAFAEEGLDAHAELLRRKAKLRQLSPENARARGLTFLRGLASSNVEAVDRLAANYQAEGSIVAAKALRRHADALRSVRKGSVDGATVEGFEQKLAMVAAEFDPDSKPFKSATANVTAARQVFSSASTVSPDRSAAST